MTCCKASDPLEHEIGKSLSANNTVAVTNLSYTKVTSEKQVINLMALANQNRATAQTSVNDRSSRSHSVFQLDIVSKNTGRKLKFKCE